MNNGWKAKNLGDVCHVIGGGTPSKAIANYYSGEIPWATVRDMRHDVIADTECKITTDAVKNSATNIIPRGNVVIATRVGLGKVCLLHQDTAINQDLRGIIPKDPKAPLVRYLFWWLKNIAELIVAEGKGATVQGVTLPFVKALQIPLPPLPEQRRIVGTLDEAFEGIATAKANAARNLQNAAALFQSHLESIFTRRREGWVETTLGDICRFENGDRGKNYPKRAEYAASGIPWINTGHIQPDGTLSESEMNFISPQKYKSLRSGKIQPGDLVYCLRGATLGKTALVEPFTEGAVASSLVIIRPGKQLDRRFLYYFLTSPPGQRLIKLYDNGAAQPNLGAKSVAKYTISVPTRAEQESIVQKLVALAAETQRLASLYKQKVTALESLKKSLLHQAFTGKL
ncbi:MAG: restriction modification system specificity domain protein [Acidobacteriaceae bacterium]|nr:restriction modification system specificity domain protein [Acidobacteriaceae bacterium]